MSDTTSILLSAIVSFFLAAAIGFFGKRSLTADIMLMVGSGFIVIFGYLLIFGNWSEPIENEKLMASLLLSVPGLVIYFFLPLIPGYALGIFLKDKIRART